MRFVILDHQPPTSKAAFVRTSERHFDLMLEQKGEGGLKTFAFNVLPKVHDKIVVTRLADHRVAYLTYEGEVKGQRGTVTRHAEGTWSGEIEGDTLLSFDTDSPNFAGESWAIRIRAEEEFLLRIR